MNQSRLAAKEAMFLKQAKLDKLKDQVMLAMAVEPASLRASEQAEVVDKESLHTRETIQRMKKW
jgi:hypothetical protein